MLCLRRVIGGATAMCALAGGSLLAQQVATLPGVQMLEIDGRTVRVQVLGLDHRREGMPVVVFEAGATNSLEVWG